MSFEFMHDLGIITIINFVVVFTTTIGILYATDKIKEKFSKKDRDK